MNILVVLPQPMGDAILATPALRWLRGRLPEARIFWAGNATARGVLAGCPWLDGWVEAGATGPRVWATKTIQALGCGAAILLVNSFRSALTVWLAGIPKRMGYRREGRGIFLTKGLEPFRLGGRYAPISMIDYYGYLAREATKVLGRESAQEDFDSRLELFTEESDWEEVGRLLKRWGVKEEERLAVLVPGGAYGPSKCWPVERFAAVAEQLSGEGFTVVVSCAPNEAERRIATRIVSTARGKVFSLGEEELSLGGLKELVRRSKLMVANDTGPCHIAAAFGVPLVTIFGPTDPRWTATGHAKEIRLRAEVDCGPCQEKTCGRDLRCLKQIEVEEVLAAVRQLLESTASGEVSSEGAVSEKRERNKEQGGLVRRLGRYYEAFEESFEPAKDGSGLVHQDYRELLEKNGLSGIAGVFAYKGGEALVKPGLGRRERIRAVLRDESGECTVVYIKRFREEKSGGAEKGRPARRGRAGAAVNDFAAAVELGERGIPAARPLAYGQEGGRRFVIIEGLPNGGALERILPEWEAKKRQYDMLNDKRELLAGIARLARRLHEAGFCHRDFYLSHIFLCKDREGRERLCLIDLQRVFRPGVRTRRWRIKDLGQFYFSARSYFTEMDMLVFFREYFGSRVFSTAQTGFIRGVYRKAHEIDRREERRQRRKAGPTKEEASS